MVVRTRIAPSPTGIVHVGNIYTALVNYAFAKKQSGKFILRIEDTDRERYVPGSESIIFSAFRWLGIAYDEGPDIGGPYAPYTQSQRLPTYQAAARRLIARRLAYYCFCSPERLAAMRAAQQQAGKRPMYDGACRNLDANEAGRRARKERHVVRLKVPRRGNTSWRDLIRGEIKVRNAAIDDQVLLKSDGYPTYHLAVVVDDHAMRISHVLRAEEWISSTPKHLLLFRAFGWRPPRFAHTPLLRNPDRTKLSKRRNPVSVVWYKEQGYLPEALVNYLALMGWSHPEGKEKFTLEEFVDHISLDRIQTSQPIFDVEKLRWLNGRYLREMAEAELVDRLHPFLPKGATTTSLRRILPLVRERIHTLTEFRDYADFFYTPPDPEAAMLVEQSRKSAPEVSKKLVAAAVLFDGLPPERFTAVDLEKAGRSLMTAGWNAKQLFMTFRVALTGKTVSPPLFESIQIIGKKETVERLKHAAENLTTSNVTVGLI